jgi:hypothetical protein
MVAKNSLGLGHHPAELATGFGDDSVLGAPDSNDRRCRECFGKVTNIAAAEERQPDREEPDADEKKGARPVARNPPAICPESTPERSNRSLSRKWLVVVIRFTVHALRSAEPRMRETAASQGLGPLGMSVENSVSRAHQNSGSAGRVSSASK